MSTRGTTTRSGMSLRSANARGKEPEVAQPVVVSEEFELVMGLFERVMHEKTEYPHHVSFNTSFPSLCDLTLFSRP
jgi:enhancer of polycomb-like protein